MDQSTLLLLKIITSAAMVIGITMVAEKGHPRFAGVLMAFPLGSALTLFFLGVEQGPVFAAHSALWAITGILGGLAFCLGYLWASQWCVRSQILSCLLATLVGYLLYILANLCLLHLLPQTAWVRFVAIIIGVPVFFLLFQLPARQKEKIVTQKGNKIFILLIRASFAASVIIAITGAAQWVGAAWSGLFATFPMTILPTIVILQITNGAQIIPHLFRETAFGMVATSIFATAIYFSYPHFGVGLGLAISYAVAFCYLLLYEFILRVPLTGGLKKLLPKA